MPVQIGSRFTGQNKTFLDTESGAYWEVLPEIKGQAALIQRALLAQPPRPSLLARIVGTAQ